MMRYVKAHGYHTMRLDSAEFLHSAHKLFKSYGFKDRDRYEGTEVPAEFSHYFMYMEMSLA